MSRGIYLLHAPDVSELVEQLDHVIHQGMTTIVTGPDYPGIGVGLGIWSVETPCGTVWGHEGGAPGYKSFALNDRGGTRSAVVIAPTEPDEAIGAAIDAAVATAVCQMLDRDPLVAS